MRLFIFSLFFYKYYYCYAAYLPAIFSVLQSFAIRRHRSLRNPFIFLYRPHKRVIPEGQYHTAIVHLPGAIFGFVSILNRLSYQSPVAEFTVVQKLNRSVPEIGRSRFRATFCVTFFRKKGNRKESKRLLFRSVRHPPLAEFFGFHSLLTTLDKSGNGSAVQYFFYGFCL